jgi:FtsP/CotA-like multicopper oxidase with cupredoxin domain
MYSDWRKLLIRGLLTALFLTPLIPMTAKAQDGDACPRPAAGSVVKPPPEIRSHGGTLTVALNYKTSVDSLGRTLFCFVTPDGDEAPTLKVNPGDLININLTNAVGEVPGQRMPVPGKQCGDKFMTLSSVNIHFHGINTSPMCHSDEVIHTIVNSGETFSYSIRIPKNEPPGLYWYHPHIHGISSAALQGGASGAIIVNGLANVQPAVTGLPERLIVLRDQRLGASLRAKTDQPVPNWDVSVNYVPVSYPDYTPAVIEMHRGAREVWRVVNASANTIMNLVLLYDGKAQPLQIVALDGVPTGSQDGTQQGTIVTEKEILLPPAARVEFIVRGPSSEVASAVFMTKAIHGGPASDSNPERPLAIVKNTTAPVALPRLPARSGPPNRQRFEGLSKATVTANRTLYFSEKGSDDSGGSFFITVDGQQPTVFSPQAPPAIVTNKGAVEDWTVENRSKEVHEFHIHQIHFLLLAVDGVPVPLEQQQFYDTHQIGFWKGKGNPYPSITMRMDFRGAVVGDFVYHCHILDHEDAGMMAILRVKAAAKP